MDPPYRHSEPTAARNDQFERLLDGAVQGLKNDFVSGARQMADTALSDISRLIEATQDMAQSRGDLWRSVVSAARALCDARPSMNAAVTSCLLRALDAIANAWDKEGETGKEKTAVDLARVAKKEVDGMLARRKEAGVRLGKNLVGYIGYKVASSLYC
jgi:hypothetical protein